MLKNKKKVYPCVPQFYYIKNGYKGVQITWICFLDYANTCMMGLVLSCLRTRSNLHVTLDRRVRTGQGQMKYYSLQVIRATGHMGNMRVVNYILIEKKVKSVKTGT